MAAKTIYVAGFLFRRNREEVALVRKEKPEWQKGRLNGIGGKVEPGETEYAAMVREFREETGAEIKDWTPVAVLDCGDAVVHFFRSDSGDGVRIFNQNDVGEALCFYLTGVITLSSTLIPNLRWLLPMAADTDQPFGEIKSGFSS
jgi:8-oxo-dGTP diphosphatase